MCARERLKIFVKSIASSLRIFIKNKINPQISIGHAGSYFFFFKSSKKICIRYVSHKIVCRGLVKRCLVRVLTEVCNNNTYSNSIFVKHHRRATIKSIIKTENVTSNDPKIYKNRRDLMCSGYFIIANIVFY